MKNTELIQKILESQIGAFMDLYKESEFDDESEFFPCIKTLLLGTLNNLENAERDEIKQWFENHFKQKYVAVWLEYAEEDCETKGELKAEVKNAEKRFKELWK